MTTQISDIDLSNKLTKISRKIKTLTSSIPTNPSTPGDFVAKAEIDAEIAELQAEQITIGKELLDRDKAATERKKKCLEDAISQGGKNAKALSEKLTDFADKLSLVTNSLSADYAEILELSLCIRRANSLMLNSNLPHITTLKLEANNIHKVVKTQLVKTFGTDTVNVFLPQNVTCGELPDIVEVVKEITHHES